MSDTLTYKEARFAEQYVAKNGNAMRAAIAAGYSERSAHVTACMTLKKPRVKKRIADLTLKYEITPQRVLKRLDNLSAAAQSDGQHGAAIKAEELLGKHLNMWVDRTLSVHVDLTTEHLAALQALIGLANAEPVQDHITHIMESDEDAKSK